MPSGLCVLDESLQVLYANPTFGAMFAINESETIGRHVRDVLPHSLLKSAGVEAAIHYALTESGARVLAGVTVKSDNVEKTINVRVTPAQMPEGLGVLLMFEDVTEWRRAIALAEERLRHIDLIVSHVPVAVISWDTQNRFTFWGSGAKNLFGRTEEEVIGKLTPADVFEHSDEFDALLERCAQESKAEGNLFVKRKDGSRVPSLVAFGKLMDNAGAHVGYTAIVTDITDRFRAQEEILREKQKLENVVRVIGAGLALIDKERRITWANRTLQDWFGREGPLEGRPCHVIACGGESPAPDCPAETCFSQRIGAETDRICPRADGTTRQYHFAFAPVSVTDDEVDTVLMLALDITDQYKKIFQLSRLRQLGELMQGLLDLDRLLYFVLTCVTAGQGLGFNRAVLMLLDRDRNLLEGRIGVGPGSGEEAGRIWSQINEQSASLEDLLYWYDTRDRNEPTPMDHVARSISISMNDAENIIVQCAAQKRPIVVEDAPADTRVPGELRDLLGSRQFVLAPLIARNETVGVIVADNLYSGEPITPEDVELLCMFANQAAMAIQNAESYQRLEEDKDHLENAYRELADAQDKLVRSERLVAMGRMAAHVAHEIRNPLVNIGGFAKAICRRPDIPRETIIRYANIITSEVRRLENILARVMDFTKPPHPLMRECRFAPIVHDTITQLRNRVEEQSIRIVTNLCEEKSPLYLDPDQIKQVLLNLFQNALDVMKADDVLEVATRYEKEVFVCTVRNTGAPIHPEDLGNLFEPFFSTKPGGTGLGLTVSQKIIQDHGGDITVRSDREHGTQFIFTMPLKGKATHAPGHPKLSPSTPHAPVDAHHSEK